MTQFIATGLEPIRYSVGLPPCAEWLRCGDIRLCVASGEVEGPRGSAQLPPVPRLLLKHLIERVGEPVPKDGLAQRFVRRGSDNTLKIQIHRVRSALSEVGAVKLRIRVFWGCGYILETVAGEATVNLKMSVRQYRELQALLANAERKLPGVRARIGL